MRIEKEAIEKIIDGVEYIEEITYRVYDDGTKEVGCTVKYPKVTGEPVEPEPSQLDRMEEMLKKSHEEIKNDAIDEYTSMLMEEGVL